MTAYYAALLVKYERAEEPVAGGDDDIIEFVDFGSPYGVGLVEVEVEEAGVRWTMCVC